MLRVVALSIGAYLVATSAYAQVERTPTAVKVSTRGVDFYDRSEAKGFYERLRIAARLACDSGASRDLAARLDDQKCARQAVVNAVRSLQQPMLSEIAGLPAATSLASNAP